MKFKRITVRSVPCAIVPVKHFGPSGVRALPLAAGINVGGHNTWHYFSSLFFFSLSEVLTFLPERRQLGLQNFAWAPKSQKY
jgi:hypothetical protein